MTEAEMVEAITNYLSIANVQTTQSLGLVFGYLAVAHFIGPQLSRFQVIGLSSLYLLIAGSAGLASLGAQLRAADYAQRLQDLRPEDQIFLASNNGMFSLVVSVLTLLASLWYMWSVRHPKSA